jgi:hypothetical protein
MIIKPTRTSPATIFLIMASTPGTPSVLFDSLHLDHGCALIARAVLISSARNSN